MLEKRPRFLDPKSDIVFKKIFGQHPELIKSFLNSILPLPEGCLIESVDYLTPEQSPRIPSMKNTIVDVKCKDQEGRVFIVEMQMTWSKSFLKRFLFGTSKAYVQQLEKGKYYNKLCPVYGVALVNTEFENATDDWFHHYRLTNAKNLDKTLEGIELVFLELPKFNPQTFEHRKVGVLWLRFLRETRDLNEIPEEFRYSPEVMQAIELAEESAYTPEELEAYDEYLDAIRVEGTLRADSFEQGKEEERQRSLEENKKIANQMLAKGEQIGMAKGEQIGMAKGEQIGMAKGEQKFMEEKQSMARKMLAKGMSIDEVSDFTGLSVEEIQSFKASPDEARGSLTSL